MPCSGTIDPADISFGVLDPADDPTNPLPEISIPDVSVVTDPDGSMWARFVISMTNVNFDNDVSCTYNTANGTGSAGTHYVAQVGQTLVIPQGEGEGLIEVPVLKPAGATGQKTFFVNLSVPSNCTIIDTQGRATIDYGTAGNPPPPPPPDPDPDPGPGGDPADWVSHAAWPSNVALIYDQTADCKYYYACTAFAGAGAMSALNYVKRNQNQRFDAKKLFTDAGGSICAPCVSGCHAFNPVKVLRWMRDHSVKHLDSADTKHLSSFSIIGDTNLNARIRNMKRAIANNGAVYASTFWKQKWNSCSKGNSPNNNDHVLADPTNLPAYLGHAYLLVGWNNNRAGGSFELQSTFGAGWGVNGRCWMPYAYLTQGMEFYKMVLA